MVNFDKFASDLVENISASLKEINSKFDLRSTDLNKALLKYVSLCTKLITVKPRKVLISKELTAKLRKNPDIEKHVNYMVEKIRKGEDINFYLTRRNFIPNKEDMLFSDWSIKHIHLSEREVHSFKEMKYNRSNMLLFALFEFDSCYLIDVCTHNKKDLFFNINFLRIIVNNWPNKFFEKLNTTEVFDAIETSEEVDSYRKKNINCPVYKIDNISYIKKGLNCLSCNGINIEVFMLVKRLVQLLEKIDDVYCSLEFNFLDLDFGIIHCVQNNYAFGLDFS